MLLTMNQINKLQGKSYYCKLWSKKVFENQTKGYKAAYLTTIMSEKKTTIPSTANEKNDLKLLI